MMEPPSPYLGEIVIFRVGSAELSSPNDAGPHGQRDHPAIVTGVFPDLSVDLTVLWRNGGLQFGVAASARSRVAQWSSDQTRSSWRPRY